jgi:polar amino acid transport system substrate-binding protein
MWSVTLVLSCLSRRGLVAAVAALVLPLLLEPAGATTTALPAHIVIASEGARPPYNYLEGDKLEGFEIDLGTDLCRRMKVSCTFVAQDWDSLIPGLIAGRYDAIMAAMEIDDARKAQIDFSQPYVRMPSAFLVQKSTTLTGSTPDALAGHRIGVEQGGPHETFLTKVYPQSKIKHYGSLQDAILDLEAGRVDAAIGDKDAIVAFLQTRRDAACCKILADVPRDPVFFGAGVAVGLRKNEPVLKAAFDKALAECKADGTFAAISARYFNFPID